MIRLNAFFEVNQGAEAQVLALGKELVEASLKDKGCVAYDLFCSTTRPQVMMFCETWQDDEALAAHSSAEHFTRIVPQIEALTKAGMHLNRFEF
ncbi:MAG: antibiotic biosynthesis monooxygenase [Prevotella sp.]|nr:antibiotic biosynthesis monooxygenase [Prevotella sp.]